MTHPSWHSVGHSFITWQPLPGFNKDTLLLVLADIGATVTPWMLFFQQSATVDKGMTTKDIRFGRIEPCWAQSSRRQPLSPQSWRRPRSSPTR